MQFIPTTWGNYGRDGNGDGWADPHNIYDAARSAAHYLCRIDGLGDGARLREAILTYNYSTAYVDAVLRWAERYRQIGL
jgi:membrane-bound lytic murein transglycosylase B